MKRLYEAFTSGTPPSPGTATGYPTDGAVGVPATVPGAGWFHAVASELLNVITAAGLTPSGTDLTQLTQAILALGYDWATNTVHGDTGHRKFPDGMIENWAFGQVTAQNATLVIAWNLPFPTHSNVPMVSVRDSSGVPGGTTADIIIASVQTYGLSSVTVDAGANGGGSRLFQIIARANGY